MQFVIFLVFAALSVAIPVVWYMTPCSFATIDSDILSFICLLHVTMKKPNLTYFLTALADKWTLVDSLSTETGLGFAYELNQDAQFFSPLKL